MDLEQIRQLIDLLIEKDVGEFELEQEGVKVKIRRRNGDVMTSVTATATAPAAASEEVEAMPPAPGDVEVAEGEAPTGAFVVTSPIVGTFYRASEPDADPFCEVGDVVEEGQTLCIVEAMKLMNEITAEIAGEVVAVFVDNGEPVEYGQQLFAIKPAGA